LIINILHKYVFYVRFKATKIIFFTNLYSISKLAQYIYISHHEFPLQQFYYSDVMNLSNLQAIIETTWENRESLKKPAVQETIDQVIQALDSGQLRIAAPATANEPMQWEVYDWVKKAILLYFLIQPIKNMEAFDFQFFDKIPLKKNFNEIGVRVVPPGVVRYGTFLAPGVVIMASYVNIGAYIGANTMIDIGAAVGSCAQIGKNCHISAGAVIGGVLEPLQAQPVVIADDVFIGANSAVLEGILIEKGVVLAAGLTLTASTHIIDVTATSSTVYRGYIPANSVVIPGTYEKLFPAGRYQVPCALIIGKRQPSTEAKVQINQMLRSFDLKY